MAATIVVEDGTQVSGANSYITSAELDTYASDRGVTISGTQAILLIEAMDYIEAQDFLGYKLTETQALVWPRGDVLVDGYYIDQDEIPTLLKDAQAEVALAIDAGNGPLDDITREEKKVRVGEIEVEYADSAAATTLVRKINAKLAKLLASGSSGLSFKVSRA